MRIDDVLDKRDLVELQPLVGTAFVGGREFVENRGVVEANQRRNIGIYRLGLHVAVGLEDAVDDIERIAVRRAVLCNVVLAVLRPQEGAVGQPRLIHLALNR